MSDTPDRNDESPHTTPAGSAEVAGRGHLFDTTLYQAWAIDADGNWRYLPADAGPDDAADAAGESWRALTKAGALRCPYPGCGAAFSGVRKGAGRVAFVHPKTETTHSDKQAKQAMWRLAGSQAVARWAARAFPDGKVRTADLELTPAPDVLVEAADGARIAVHLLSDKVSDADWQAQADAHRQAGVRAVWLVAHTGAFARKATGTERYRPAAPVPAALAAGATVAWLNPFLGLVGRAADGDATALALTELPLDAWRLDAGSPADEPAAPSTDATEPTAASADASEPTAPSADASEPTAAPSDTPGSTVDAEASADSEPTARPVPAAAEATGAEDAAGAGAQDAKPPRRRRSEAKDSGEGAGAAGTAAGKGSAAADGAAASSGTAEAGQAETAGADEAQDADVTAGTDQPVAVEGVAGEPAASAAAEDADAKDADLTAGTDQPATAGTKPAEGAGSRPASRSGSGTRPPAAPQRSGGWLRRMLDRLRRPAA